MAGTQGEADEPVAGELPILIGPEADQSDYSAIAK